MRLNPWNLGALVLVVAGASLAADGAETDIVWRKEFSPAGEQLHRLTATALPRQGCRLDSRGSELVADG